MSEAKRIPMEDDGGGFDANGNYVFPDGHRPGAGIDWSLGLGRYDLPTLQGTGHAEQSDPAVHGGEATVVLSEGERVAAETMVVPIVGHDALQAA